MTTVSVAPGQAVEAGQSIAEVVPDGQVCVELRVSEAETALIFPGQSAVLTLAGADEDTTIPGTVMDISHTAEDAAYVVRILPQTAQPLPLGLSVTARLE